MNDHDQTHQRRGVTSLDGFWDFAFLGDADPCSTAIEGIRFDDKMTVPGCFDATPRYAGKRGLAAYRKTVPLRAAAFHRLVFESVQHWCRAYVNQEPVGEHSGGFTRFHIDFEAGPGQVELLVLVDNRLNTRRSPLHLDYYDWYHYGGISRPVWLHSLEDTWIDRLEISTQSLQPPAILLKVFYGQQQPGLSRPVRVRVDGEIVLGEDLILPEASGVLEREIVMPEAALWSPEDPNLHELTVSLGPDDFSERFGVRQVAVSGQEILINDRPVRLLGVNRHEAHPQFGCALPEALMVADLQQIIDLGCNFIRGSHYPNDPRFLDLCDELGVCVWIEATGWQHTAGHLNDPQFMDAQLAHIDEMVAMSINHPSVIIWGALNESDSNDRECQAGYRRILGRIKERDDTRPVTYASHRIIAGDLCLDLVDIVSINMYPGWYLGDLEDIPGFLDTAIAQVDEEGQSEKPIIFSEIGAGAVYGWRDPHQERWSEQYQANLLDAVIRHLFLDMERVAGIAIWQFCDIRASEKTERILGRPLGFNNKGLVDAYRRPKLAYETVKSLFRPISTRPEKRPSTAEGRNA